MVGGELRCVKQGQLTCADFRGGNIQGQGVSLL